MTLLTENIIAASGVNFPLYLIALGVIIVRYKKSLAHLVGIGLDWTLALTTGGALDKRKGKSTFSLFSIVTKVVTLD